LDGIEPLIEFLVGIGGVELFMAGFAEGRAVVGFAASLFGFEVMEGDEGLGDGALAKGAGLGSGRGRLRGDRRGLDVISLRWRL
jgi:hypothetical protein